MTQHIELGYGRYPVHFTFDVVHRPSTRSGSFQFDSLPSLAYPFKHAASPEYSDKDQK